MVKAGVPGATYQWSSQAAFSNIERLTPRVWRVEEDDESCTYVIVGSERVVLVDGSPSAYGPWVDSFLKAALPHASKLPRLCINTHRERAGGNASLQKLGVAVAASARPRPAAQHRFEPYTIDKWLHNEEAIDLGDDQELKVLQTPGHTPDSLCLWYERDQILFTGATIQASSTEDTEALHRSATLLQSTYRGRIGKRQTHDKRAASIPKPTPKKKSLWGSLRSATSLLRSSSKKLLDDLPTPSKTVNYRTARDHRSRLIAFFEKHDPSKISSVDAVLEACAGDEVDMWKLLRATYEPIQEEAKAAPRVRVRADVASEASSLFDLRDSLSRLAFVARDVKIIGGGRGPVLGADALRDLLKLVEDAVTRKVEPVERSAGIVFFERGDASFRARAYELQM
jgi:glyoxylase-like metal-dependent hydrolase (beta-lactamase superfamily II)